jgi:hypothetical protein
MTRRRRLALVVGGVVIAAALAGCADDTTTSETDKGSPAATTAATETTAPTSPPSPTAPDATTDDSTAVVGQQPEGFTTIQARITKADGEVCEVCLWLADDGEERGRGLMGVTDLGDAVGMAFVFEEATAGSFYMFQTPSPLSIAWFSPDGNHVGSADMEPCLDLPAGDCPLYSPDASYDLAIEVFDGGLEPLGLGPGSRVELIDGTEADSCPSAA